MSLYRTGMQTAAQRPRGLRTAARRRSELAFLPAALEIVETPPSPTARYTAITFLLMLAGLIGWSALGKVDIVTTAPGRIISSGRTKVLQPFEISIVKSIDVADGQHVSIGQPLIVLDPTENEAERNRAAHALMLAQVDQARLHALLDGDVTHFRPAADADEAVVETARKLMLAQDGSLQAKLADLDHQLEGKRAERAETEGAIRRIDATMPMLQAHLRIRGGGVNTGFGNQIDYYDAMRLVVDQQQERAIDLIKMTETSEGLAALQHQREEAVSDFRAGVLSDLAKAEAMAADKQQDLAKAAQRTRLETLRAPVAGTVQQLSLFTIGGVVTPAQPVLAIVPDDAPLEVEAMVPNREVGFVHVGQDVEVKVESLEFTRYGLLHGVVTSVSRDIVAADPLRQGPGAGPRPEENDPKSGERREAPPDGDPNYAAHIRIAERGLQTEQGYVPLEPGMTVAAEIKTGQRTVLDYLLSPLRRYRHDALTER